MVLIKRKSIVMARVLIVFFNDNISNYDACIDGRYVRDRRATYMQSLSILEHAKQYKPLLMTKTSIMLGHGETDDQVMKTLQGCITSYWLLAVSLPSLVG